jgi:hypothetical protein
VCALSMTAHDDALVYWMFASSSAGGSSNNSPSLESILTPSGKGEMPTDYSSSQLHVLQGLHGDSCNSVLKFRKGEAAGVACAITGDPDRADLPEGREDGL